MSKSRKSIVQFLHNHPKFKIYFLLSPAAIWLVAFTLMPLAVILLFSFLTKGPWGTIVYDLTLANYQQISDPVFMTVFFRSFRMAILTVAICISFGYPVAYLIAMYGRSRKNLLIFLIILPFWTSFLVRIYSWMIILSDHGLVNTILVRYGIINSPLALLHNEFAVMIGLVYTYLPFMILPLFASIDKLDRSLLEAAADLGASPISRFRKITLPLTKGGILSGSILVFVGAIGEFLIPELLGGAKAMMIGKFIEMKFIGLRNWPLGSAYSLVLLTIISLLLFVYVRVGGEKEGFQRSL